LPEFPAYAALFS